MKRLNGVELTLTDDSYELAKPSNCDILQVINYRPDGKILMDNDLFGQMPTMDQAALIVHEAYYSFLRDNIYGSEEKNSIRTRRSVGYVMAGHSFQPQERPIFGRHILCEAAGVPFSPTIIHLYHDESLVSPNEPPFTLSPFVEKVFGSALIGSLQPTVRFSFGETHHNNLFNGSCDRDGFEGAIRFSGNGPVEFDHEISIEWNCKNKILQTHITEHKPGEPPRTTELLCETINSTP